MTKPLSSRERMLAVLHYQEPDHVPLILNPFGFKPWWTTRPLNNQVDVAEAFLDFGLDAWLSVDLPLVFHPDVRVRQRTEKLPPEQWPCMIKEYETPAGVLRQEVYLTDDWVSEQWPGHRAGEPTVNLLDDYNVPRYRRCPIQDEQDLEKLKYLYPVVSDDSAGKFRLQTEKLAREAHRLGVLLRSCVSAGTDAAMWLCGPESLLHMALDQPDLFDALLSVIHVREKRNTQVLLDTPVDLVMRRGYYEGTAFWSPSIYRRSFMPRFKELTDLAHQGGKLMGYTMSVGYMPLLEVFAEIGYDAHYLLDPVPSGGQRADLGKVKAVLDGKIAVIGALNEPVTLERGSPRDIREEVFAAVRVLGRGGGLALSPAEAVYNFTPRESLETLFEAWKQVRDYPLGF